jgi:hypothetical protein
VGSRKEAGKKPVENTTTTEKSKKLACGSEAPNGNLRRRKAKSRQPAGDLSAAASAFAFA